MERSTRIVEEGLSLGNDLGSALHKISNVVTEVYKFSQEIGAATNEQSVGSSQIAKATGRLTEITQEINSAVEEQASGAQAVVRAMDKMRELVQQSASSSTELSAAAEQMLKLSRNLLDSMDRFVLDRSVAQPLSPAARRSASRRSQRTIATKTSSNMPNSRVPEAPETMRWKKTYRSSGFASAMKRIGVRIAAVREIVRVPEITAVPSAPDTIEGVINLRGKIIPVMDLRKRFGQVVHPRGQKEPHSGRRDRQQAGGSDRQRRFRSSENSARPTSNRPAAVFAEGESGYVTGVGKLKGRLIILLDISKLLHQPELQRLEEAAESLRCREVAWSARPNYAKAARARTIWER